jgi:UDP-N-acetylglucosamine 1-carboxyvinyltransferase
MAKLIIEGGRPLKGQITVHGAKNAALPILAAAMLIPEPVRITNCPRLTDVENMAGILQALGCRVDWVEDGLLIDAGSARTAELPEVLAGSIRSSVFLLGPLLGRFGAAEAPFPGGCDIGNRPVDLHLKGFRAMGVKVDEASGRIRCLGRPRGGTEIALEYPSVGATENLLMAACGAEEDTVLVNPAREPEIDDLMAFLNGAGFDLKREGSSRIRVRGGRRGHSTSHVILPDRIETGTYLVAAAITGGHVLIRGGRKEHLSALLMTLREAGCRIRIEGTDLDVEGPERPRELRRLVTLPYPGFPTDMQSQVFALCTVAKGTSVLEENVFENRFCHGAELKRMGADCYVRGRTAVIRGVKGLRGAQVTAHDLRGGAALALAGLRAEGITVVNRAERIDRGYAKFAATLRDVGAAIRREDD